jgi:CSLREA domain-containing protein
MARRIARLVTALLGAGFVITQPPLPVHALTTITVTTTADDYIVSGNCSLREAIAASNANQQVDACAAGGVGQDQIVLQPLTYTLSIPGPFEDAGLTGDLDISGDLDIVGAGAVIDAAGIDRVFEILAQAQVQLTGVTVRGGYIQVNADPSIDSNKMGGGIFVNKNGFLAVIDSTITGNVVDHGDFGPGLGAGLGNDGTLDVVRTRVINNSMGDTYPDGSGGGIANNGDLGISDSTIGGNHAWDGGGGVYTTGSMNAVHATFSGNSTGCFECESEGGGIYNSGGLVLVDSTISSNGIDAGDYSTQARGGGLFSIGLFANLLNVTVANNSVVHRCDSHCFASPEAGGISAPNGAVFLIDTILANNTTTENQSEPNGGGSVTTASDCTGSLTSDGYNLVRTLNGCGFTPSSTDITGVDPLLGTLQGNGGLTWTHNLLPGSPAIDAGNPKIIGSGTGACARADQRGLPRSDDGNLDGTQRCDIGAVEKMAIDNSSYRVRLDGWSGTTSGAASGGGFRSATSAGAAATFTQSSPAPTTSVAFLTFKGPNMGRANVVVDGVSHTVDLYVAGQAVRTTLTYPVTSAAQHTVRVTALGTKNAASTGTQVRVDGFKLGTANYDDSSPSVRYGFWSGARNGRASGGSMRVGSPGGVIAFDTVGPVFTLILERGPSFGKAQVTIDGTSHGTVETYSATTKWLARQTYSGLGTGTHRVVVTVLTTKNPASTGTNFVFDGVTLR